MNPARVADFLAELAALAQGTEGLQVLVAMQGPQKARGAVPAARLRSCGPGEFLW